MPRTRRLYMMFGVLILAGVTAGVFFAGEAFSVLAGGEACAKKAKAHGAASGAGCSKAAGEAGVDCEREASATDAKRLSEDDLRVVEFIAALVGEDGQVREAGLEDIRRATGVEVTADDLVRLREPILAAVEKRHPGFLAAAGGQCARFSACSVDRNLNFASGEELERYEAERALDGRPAGGAKAPEFALPATTGETVRLSDLRGSPVAVVFLTAHCSHSLDTLPILADLKARYEPEGVRILPVFVNSGGVDTLASRAWEWGVDYPLLAAEGKQISRDYDSRMVPSTFLVDARGTIRTRLVGFKTEAELDRALRALLDS